MQITEKKRGGGGTGHFADDLGGFVLFCDLGGLFELVLF